MDCSMNTTTEEIETKGPGGRPSIHPDENRDQRFNLRFTVTELEYVEKQAAAAGIKPHEYLRRRALGYQIEAPSGLANAALLHNLNDLCLKLSKAGNVANQIARNLHTGRRVDDDWMLTSDLLNYAASEARVVLEEIGNNRD